MMIDPILKEIFENAENSEYLDRKFTFNLFFIKTMKGQIIDEIASSEEMIAELREHYAKAKKTVLNQLRILEDKGLVKIINITASAYTVLTARLRDWPSIARIIEDRKDVILVWSFFGSDSKLYDDIYKERKVYNV